MPSLFWLKAWRAPAVGPVKLRPPAWPGRSDRQRQWLPGTLDPGRQIVAQDNPSGVSRIGGQAASQRQLTLRPRHDKPRSRAGSIIRPRCRLGAGRKAALETQGGSQIGQLGAASAPEAGRQLRRRTVLFPAPRANARKHSGFLAGACRTNLQNAAHAAARAREGPRMRFGLIKGHAGRI